MSGLRRSLHMPTTATLPPSRARAFACAFTFATTLLLGCGGGGETINPLPTASETTSTSGTGGGGTGGTGGSGGGAPVTPIRTVEQRNPFGNVAATDNLLWDGDFEWTSPFSDQYGWLYGQPYGYAFPAATIGAACRSGIKCVTLPKNKGVIGIGVGSATAALAISAYARPKTAVCADVDVSLIGLFTSAEDIPVPATAEAPDALGWCSYQATVPSYPQKVYLLIDNNTGDEVVVDDVVVRALLVGQPPPPAPPPAFVPPSLERLEHHAAAREAAVRLRGPYIPPPNEAKRAFQELHAR